MSVIEQRTALVCTKNGKSQEPDNSYLIFFYLLSFLPVFLLCEYVPVRCLTVPLRYGITQSLMNPHLMRKRETDKKEPKERERPLISLTATPNFPPYASPFSQLPKKDSGNSSEQKKQSWIIYSTVQQTDKKSYVLLFFLLSLSYVTEMGSYLMLHNTYS